MAQQVAALMSMGGAYGSDPTAMLQAAAIQQQLLMYGGGGGGSGEYILIIFLKNSRASRGDPLEANLLGRTSRCKPPAAILPGQISQSKPLEIIWAPMCNTYLFGLSTIYCHFKIIFFSLFREIVAASGQIIAFQFSKICKNSSKWRILTTSPFFENIKIDKLCKTLFVHVLFLWDCGSQYSSQTLYISCPFHNFFDSFYF